MSVEPVLLGDGDVVAAGKSRIAYLLDGTRLGGIGGQEAALGSICSEDVDGGSAWVGTTVYLPCLSGTVADQGVGIAPSLRVLWSSGSGGGPPIVAAGLVWTIGQDGTLYGLDPGTGAIRQQAHVGQPANHFPTPSVGDGLLLAPSGLIGLSPSPRPLPAHRQPPAGGTEEHRPGRAPGRKSSRRRQGRGHIRRRSWPAIIARRTAGEQRASAGRSGSPAAGGPVGPPATRRGSPSEA